MKYATIYKNGKDLSGIVQHDMFYSFREMKEKNDSLQELPLDLLEVISQFDTWKHALQSWSEETRGEAGFSIEDVQWLAPLSKPLKNIFCIGKNYADHAKEFGSTPPEHMIVFTKAPTSVTGHNQPVPLHEGVTSQLDYEGELAVVIGKKGKAISKEEAEEYIFGYTILNDLTARDLQAQHQQFFLGKSLDQSCPIGPVIVSKDQIENAGDLEIETKVNGEQRQYARTSSFLFSIAEIIATLSKGMTLEPGDIIATGTPAGVGKGMNPPRYLQDGDEIEVKIEGIGTLRTTIQAGMIR